MRFFKHVWPARRMGYACWRGVFFVCYDATVARYLLMALVRSISQALASPLTRADSRCWTVAW